MTDHDTLENIRMIQESARAVVPVDLNLPRVRELRFSGEFEPAVYRTMAEMGWLVLRVPEETGGLGLGMREQCALAEVLGSGIVPEPFIGGSLACQLLQQRLPESAVTGERIILGAWQDKPNRLDWKHGAYIEGDRLSGKKVLVPGAAGADAFAVPTPQGIAIVEREAPGLNVEFQTTQDGGQMGLLRFDAVPVDIVPAEDVDTAIEEATLTMAAYLLGLAESAFAITLEYLKLRKQFERPIGSFQALQHRAVDMKIQLSLARASVSSAAAAIDNGATGIDLAACVSQAKVRTVETAHLVSREAIQMHGAIGYTDESDIGLFVRKAMSFGALFGSASLHRSRYAKLRLEQVAA